MLILIIHLSSTQWLVVQFRWTADNKSHVFLFIYLFALLFFVVWIFNFWFFFGFNFCVAWSVSLGAMSMRLNVYRVIPCRWNCQCVYSIHTVVYWNSFRLFKTVCASNTPHAIDVWHSTPYWNLSLGYIRLFRFGLRHTSTTDTQTHTQARADVKHRTHYGALATPNYRWLCRSPVCWTSTVFAVTWVCARSVHL